MDITQNLQNGYDSKLAKWIWLKTYKMDMTQNLHTGTKSQNLQNGYDSKLTKWIWLKTYTLGLSLKTYKMDMTQI